MKQTPGKIFLGEQRGLLQTSHSQRYCTFQFGAYTDAHKEPFGNLLAFNEETLDSGQTVALHAAVAAHVLVLPITGAVQAGAAPTPLTLVEVEALCLLTVPAGGTLTLSNPYAATQVTCLHIWVAAGSAPELAVAPQIFAFSGETLANQLLAILPADGHSRPFRANLGRFAGRTEAVYQLQNLTAGFFAFVLAGAFEVAGRLLHAQDGLALWDVPTVELEALSNDALVLVLELAP
jgi:hypothetical protein